MPDITDQAIISKIPRPCFKCGHKMVSYGENIEYYPFIKYIKCDGCGVTIEGQDIEELITKWNDRPEEERFLQAIKDMGILKADVGTLLSMFESIAPGLANAHTFWQIQDRYRKMKNPWSLSCSKCGKEVSQLFNGCHCTSCAETVGDPLEEPEEQSPLIGSEVTMNDLFGRPIKGKITRVIPTEAGLDMEIALENGMTVMGKGGVAMEYTPGEHSSEQLEPLIMETVSINTKPFQD